MYYTVLYYTPVMCVINLNQTWAVVLDMSSSVQILVSAESFSYILVSAESDAIHSAANRSENSGFVQNSDQLLQMVRK